jgi:uncharacterized protein
MKHLVFSFLFAAFFCTNAFAQEQKTIPQISVSGEGKVRVIPDQVFISLAIETRGSKANDVKKQNDEVAQKIIQAIRKHKIAKEDVQTQRVNLNPVYDYERKKQQYAANQTIEILVRDLAVYETLMEALVEAGTNRIDQVEFRSSKINLHQSEARKAAMRDARAKAEDYASVLNQKVGKALVISENSHTIYPQPLFQMAMAKGADMESAPRETVAVGEINVVANVNVSFYLE